MRYSLHTSCHSRKEMFSASLVLGFLLSVPFHWLTRYFRSAVMDLFNSSRSFSNHKHSLTFMSEISKPRQFLHQWKFDCMVLYLYSFFLFYCFTVLWFKICALVLLERTNFDTISIIFPCICIFGACYRLSFLCILIFRYTNQYGVWHSMQVFLLDIWEGFFLLTSDHGHTS
jgi:hypothetical protein